MANSIATKESNKALIDFMQGMEVAPVITVNGEKTDYDSLSFRVEDERLVLDVRRDPKSPWEEVRRDIEGTDYTDKYRIGQRIPVQVEGIGTCEAVLIAFDADERDDARGRKAEMTFFMFIPGVKHRMNPCWAKEDPDDKASFLNGTGAVGGWSFSAMRKWIAEDILPRFPQELRDIIVSVRKVSRIFNEECCIFDTMEADKLWLLSRREVFGPQTFAERSGATYADYFEKGERRVMRDGDGKASWWWLRSANSYNIFYYVISVGSYTNFNASSEGGVVVGFSVGSKI